MSADQALLERVQRLEDLEEINRLFQEYRRHLDARDMHAYSLLFCEDGTWSGRTGSAVGPKQIQEMLEANLSPNPPAPGATSWHIVSNPTIELDGDLDATLAGLRQAVEAGRLYFPDWFPSIRTSGFSVAPITETVLAVAA